MPTLRWTAALVLSAGPAFGGIIIVPDDAPTIQAAADAANSGDTVEVRPGTYAEGIRVKGKSLSFVGLGGRPVLMPGSKDGFNVARGASHTSVGFFVRDSTSSADERPSARRRSRRRSSSSP